MTILILEPFIEYVFTIGERYISLLFLFIGHGWAYVVSLPAMGWSKVADLGMRLTRSLASVKMANISCGPFFEGLPADPAEKAVGLWDIIETLRHFYIMMENIITMKEEEERVRLTAVERWQEPSGRFCPPLASTS